MCLFYSRRSRLRSGKFCLRRGVRRMEDTGIFSVFNCYKIADWLGTERGPAPVRSAPPLYARPRPRTLGPLDLRLPRRLSDS